MHSLRVLREGWDGLTVEGVRVHAERAYGPDRALTLASRKLAEVQDRKDVV